MSSTVKTADKNGWKEGTLVHDARRTGKIAIKLVGIHLDRIAHDVLDRKRGKI